MGIEEQLALRLKSIALERIESDRLALPSMPAVARKVLDLLSDPDVSFKKIVPVVETDPILSAKILRVASSASYGGDVGGLEPALTRMGVRSLKVLVLEVASSQVFQSRDPDILRAFRGLWAHSLAVAILSRDLVALHKGEGADAAYLCGLLHDIGQPVAAMLLLDAERQLSTSGKRLAWIGSQQWTDIIHQIHRPVGVALAQRWILPDEVTDAIRRLDEYDVGDRKRLSNYVRLANALAKSQGLCLGKPNLEDVDALIMIGRSLLSVDEALVARLIAGISDRVTAQLL